MTVIAINALPLAQDYVSGTNVYLMNLVKALSDLIKGKTYEIALLYPGRINAATSPTLKPLEELGILDRGQVRVIEIPARHMGIWHYRTLPSYLKRAEDIDLFHDPMSISNLSGIGKKKVITVHDVSCLVNSHWCDLRTRKKYERYLYPALRDADAVICPSNFTKAEIVRMCHMTLSKGGAENSIITTLKRKLKVVPHGVGNDYYANKPDPKGPVIHVGALTPRKGYEDLMALIKTASTLRPETEFHLMGNTHEFGSRGLLRRLLSLSNLNTGQVRIIPNFAPDPGVYNGALALVSTSHYEGFNLPVLEAMASGIPVVATDIPPHRELLPDNYPLLVDVGDVKGMIRALRYLEDKGVYYNLSRTLRKRARMFTWERCAAQTLNLYDRVLRVGG